MSFSSSTWVHFFRESFLVDFNYKVLFSLLTSGFIFRGAYCYNYFFFNTVQLFGAHLLILFNNSLVALFGSLNSFLLLLLRLFSLFFLVVFFIF